MKRKVYLCLDRVGPIRDRGIKIRQLSRGASNATTVGGVEAQGYHLARLATLCLNVLSIFPLARIFEEISLQVTDLELKIGYRMIGLSSR